MQRFKLAMMLIVAMCGFVRAEEPAVIDVSDKAAISAAMGKDVIVKGTVSSAEWSASGKVMNISFENTQESGMRAALFQKKKEEFDAAFGGDLAKALTGAKVRISGKLQEFRDKPEIVLNLPSQLTIVEQAPSTQPAQ